MPTPTWITRIWHEYRAGNLTRADRDVLLTLHTFRGHGGIAWPSHATLAERARCCTRTVQRALQQAQGLGLVSWTERRVRAGWRWLRASQPVSVRGAGGAGTGGGRTGFQSAGTDGLRGRGGERKQERCSRRDAVGGRSAPGPAGTAAGGDGAADGRRRPKVRPRIAVDFNRLCRSCVACVACLLYMWCAITDLYCAWDAHYFRWPRLSVSPLWRIHGAGTE